MNISNEEQFCWTGSIFIQQAHWPSSSIAASFEGKSTGLCTKSVYEMPAKQPGLCFTLQTENMKQRSRSGEGNSLPSNQQVKKSARGLQIEIAPDLRIDTCSNMLSGWQVRETTIVELSISHIERSLCLSSGGRRMELGLCLPRVGISPDAGTGQSRGIPCGTPPLLGS